MASLFGLRKETSKAGDETSTDPWTVGGKVALCVLLVGVLCYGGYRISRNGEALPGPGHHCNAEGKCADDAECNYEAVPGDPKDHLSAGVCKAKSPHCGKEGQSCALGEVCFGTCFMNASYPTQPCSGTEKMFCLNKICDGTCQPEAKIGEKCNHVLSHSRCAAGLECQGEWNAKTCQAPDGVPCSKGKGAVECQSGYCAPTQNGYVCEALPAAGQKCNVEGLCEKNSECSHTANQSGGICKVSSGKPCYKDDDPKNKKYDKRSHCLPGLACLKTGRSFFCREAGEGDQCNGEVKCAGKLVCAEAGASGKVCKVHQSPESDIQLAEINMHRLSDRTAATSHSDDLHQPGTMHLKGTRVSAQLAPDFAEVH